MKTSIKMRKVKESSAKRQTNKAVRIVSTYTNIVHPYDCIFRKSA